VSEDVPEVALRGIGHLFFSDNTDSWLSSTSLGRVNENGTLPSGNASFVSSMRRRRRSLAKGST